MLKAILSDMTSDEDDVVINNSMASGGKRSQVYVTPAFSNKGVSSELALTDFIEGEQDSKDECPINFKEFEAVYG